MAKTLLCVILPIFSKEVFCKCLEIKFPVLKKSSNRCVKADGLFIYNFNKNSVFLIKSCVIHPTCKAQQRKTRSGLYTHAYQVLITRSAPVPAPSLASDALPPPIPPQRPGCLGEAGELGLQPSTWSDDGHHTQFSPCHIPPRF